MHGQTSNEDFVYINMNDGIGATFVLNGNLLGGPVGLTTQFGIIFPVICSEKEIRKDVWKMKLVKKEFVRDL